MVGSLPRETLCFFFFHSLFFVFSLASPLVTALEPHSTLSNMADELEEIWKKLTITEEENEGISLGSDSTHTAQELGKNCLLMQILTQRSINIEALRKTMRMIWKPNKGVLISDVEEDLFLVEFGDKRDKQKVLDMSPWSYEKNLVLLQDFDGDAVPKDINLIWSPF